MSSKTDGKRRKMRSQKNNKQKRRTVGAPPLGAKSNRVKYNEAKRGKGVAPKGKPAVGGLDVTDPKQNVTLVTKSQYISTSLSITVSADNATVSSGILAVASWLLQKGFLGQAAGDESNEIDPGTELLEGLQYYLSALQSAALGTVQNITRVPKFLNVLLEAFRPKSVPFKAGSVNYSWATVLNLNLNPTYSNSYGSWVFGTPDNTLVAYNAAIIVAVANTPSETAWNYLTKFFDQENTLTKMVDVGTPEITTKDSSVFARQYVYNGIGSTTVGGTYTDIENEVPIRCPILAKFVAYGAENLRAARDLRPSSGDSLSPFGLPLLPEFNYAEYKNKYTDVFKFIDIYEVVTWLAEWAAGIRTKYYATADAQGSNDLYFLPFSFTLQDFVIIVRQALMSVFDTQHVVQFLQPRQFASANGFVPLVAHCGTYGNSAYNNMLMPEFLVENLNSLKMHTFKPEVKFKNDRNVYRFIPVLGYYVEDTLPTFQYINFDSVTTDLFAATAQSAIRINDGGLSADFIDFNSMYYRQVMDDWNFYVDSSQQYTSPVRAIGGDKGFKAFPLITFTRFNALLTDAGSLQKGSKVGNMRKKVVYRHVSNMPGSDKLVRKDSKTTVLLPAATYATLTCVTMTMVNAVDDDMLGFLNYLILPQNRTDNTVSLQPTTNQLFQIETVEAYSRNYNVEDFSGFVGGSPLLAGLINMAEMNVTGTAAGKNSVYTDIISMLRMQNKAAGIVSSLGGMLLKGMGLDALSPLSGLIPF